MLNCAYLSIRQIPSCLLFAFDYEGSCKILSQILSAMLEKKVELTDRLTCCSNLKTVLWSSTPLRQTNKHRDIHREI